MRSPRNVTIAPIDWPCAHLESRDRFLRPRDHRLLPGDLAQFVDGRIENFRVLRRFAHAHVDDNLVEPRNRHHILQFEFFQQRRSHFLLELARSRGRSFALCRA